MTEEEKLAEEQIKRWDSILTPVMYPVALVKDFIRKSFLAGFKAGLKAGGTKWHRVADGDLPPIETGCCSIDVLIDRGRFAYYCYDNNCWFDSDTIDKIDPPKAWCEIPTYTEV